MLLLIEENKSRGCHIYNAADLAQQEKITFLVFHFEFTTLFNLFILYISAFNFLVSVLGDFICCFCLLVYLFVLITKELTVAYKLRLFSSISKWNLNCFVSSVEFQSSLNHKCRAKLP